MNTVEHAASTAQIRPFRIEDQDAIDELLDSESDQLWITQGHQLHGEPRDGERWRRTWVAEDGGDVVGAVTIARNRVHPGRFSLAVEVAATHRARGIGRRLVDHVRSLTPEPLPLAAKVWPSDAAGIALQRQLDGRVYQHCPGFCPDPSSTAVQTWAANATPSAGAAVRALADRPREEWAQLWVSQYLWVHQNWSPAAEQPLRALAREIVDEADPNLSSITIRGAQVNAVAWVFDGHDGTAEIVAETIDRHATDGVADVAACLARSLSKLADAGVTTADIDGHVTDPHLQPVLDTLPPVPRAPLDLVELDPLRSP